MSIQESALRLPWYRSLSRDQWKVLVASNLGWTFDGFEIFALFLTVGFALRQLLDVTQYAAIPEYAGYILAATVFGWATGGVIGGIIADYIGRKRTMMLAILAYSLTTGLSAFAWDWESFAVLRFLVGVAIGSEWATGASIVSELWPDHARGKGGGLLQCGAGIGATMDLFDGVPSLRIDRDAGEELIRVGPCDVEYIVVADEKVCVRLVEAAILVVDPIHAEEYGLLNMVGGAQFGEQIVEIFPVRFPRVHRRQLVFP